MDSNSDEEFAHLFKPSLFLVSNQGSMKKMALNLREGSVIALLKAWLSLIRSELVRIHRRAVGGSECGGVAEPSRPLKLLELE